jgi:hypothetical protein
MVPVSCSRYQPGAAVDAPGFLPIVDKFFDLFHDGLQLLELNKKRNCYRERYVKRLAHRYSRRSGKFWICRNDCRIIGELISASGVEYPTD